MFPVGVPLATTLQEFHLSPLQLRATASDQKTAKVVGTKQSVLKVS